MIRPAPLLFVMGLAACQTSTVSTLAPANAAINAFVEGCLSDAPSFAQAEGVFTQAGVPFFTPATLSDRALGMPAFAIAGPTTAGRGGAVCAVTINGNADAAAADAVLAFVQSGSITMSGQISSDVRIDVEGTVAAIKGEYETTDGRDFEFFVSKGKSSGGIGRVTLLSALARS